MAIKKVMWLKWSMVYIGKKLKILLILLKLLFIVNTEGNSKLWWEVSTNKVYFFHQNLGKLD